MKTRVSKLLLSLNPSILGNPSIKPPLSPLLPVFRLWNGYGSAPGRSTRGGERDDDVCEDFFLRNLNFGGGGEGEKVKKINMESDPNRLDGDGNEELLSNQPPSDRFSSDPLRRGSDLRNRYSRMGEESFDLGDDVSQSKSQSTGNRLSQISSVPKATSKEDPEKKRKDDSDESSHDSDAIFKKMKETGLIPNAVAMLDGLCKDGLIQDAMKLFGSMREKGTIPEVVIYTAVVEGFCKAGKYEDAKRIFRKMQNNGITPNAFSYQVAVQGLCKGKKLEDSVEFCLEMLDAGHSPNVITFVAMVDAICKEKGVEGAEKALRKLRESNLVLDEKALRDYLDRKGPFSPLVHEAIFGRKNSSGPVVPEAFD